MNQITVTAASVTPKCVECLMEFQPKRKDAKFCGQNCRKRHSRRKESMRREMFKAMSHIDTIKWFMERHEDLAELGLELLSKLEGKVRVTVAAVTDKN